VIEAFQLNMINGTERR